MFIFLFFVLRSVIFIYLFIVFSLFIFSSFFIWVSQWFFFSSAARFSIDFTILSTFYRYLYGFCVSNACSSQQQNLCMQANKKWSEHLKIILSYFVYSLCFFFPILWANQYFNGVTHRKKTPNWLMLLYMCRRYSFR